MPLYRRGDKLTAYTMNDIRRVSLFPLLFYRRFYFIQYVEKTIRDNIHLYHRMLKYHMNPFIMDLGISDY